MNPNPDYSAAYVILETNSNFEGHGYTFTIGRGNNLCISAIKEFEKLIVGRSLDEITSNMGKFWRALAGDSQLRWIGPEKGVIHLGLAAIINAVWDLWGKVEGKPVWRLVADMNCEALVNCVDFRHITDALTPQEAVSIVKSKEADRKVRIERLLLEGYPAYTTTPGWLGYSDEKLRTLCNQAVAEGWNSIKLKVGENLPDDKRRCRIAREAIGPSRRLMIDANQVWEVDEAVDWVRELIEFDPYWIEEPTSPDDILGHARISRMLSPLRVVTGEHAHNRVMFKQFFQADAIAAAQIDGCRLGGINEAIAVMLLAAKFDKPVCPHAGGVGLCEVVQHLSMIDYVCISGSFENAMIEHANHLHEHFLHPVELRSGRYVAPSAPGLSTEIDEKSRLEYSFPNGRAWKAL
jgi:L-fuconate dehydratase